MDVQEMCIRRLEVEPEGLDPKGSSMLQYRGHGHGNCGIPLDANTGSGAGRCISQPFQVDRRSSKPRTWGFFVNPCARIRFQTGIRNTPKQREIRNTSAVSRSAVYDSIHPSTRRPRLAGDPRTTQVFGAGGIVLDRVSRKQRVPQGSSPSADARCTVRVGFNSRN